MTEQASLWRGRRVLVTGCTGFLGGSVARELLALGAEVVGLIHNRPAASVFGPSTNGRVHFLHGRADNVFRLHSAMAVHEVAAVFHLASSAPFGEDRSTQAVLQAVKLYSRRAPVVTARPARPLALTRTEEDHDDRLSIVRFVELFGPGDRKLFRVVSATATAIITASTPALPSDGPARDFVFIRDAARACLLAAEAAVRGAAGEYAFRSGWVMTERQMASAVRDAFSGREVEVRDSAPLANPLGWRPAQSLAEALDETLAWYRGSVSGRADADALRAAA